MFRAWGVAQRCGFRPSARESTESNPFPRRGSFGGMVCLGPRVGSGC